ncbi:MAG: hypothetical protein WD990_07625 [Acidimicrobiia bacterium]
MEEYSEVGALNARIVTTLADAPAPWEVPVDVIRTARDEGQSVFGRLTVSRRAADDTLDTLRGALPIRGASRQRARLRH